MKCLSLTLACLFALQSAASASNMMPFSDSVESKPPESLQAARIKAEVEKRGTGERSRVRVKLRNGTQLSGHISNVGDTSFEVTDQSGKVTSIPYTDAAKVRGAGLSKGAKIGIVVGVAVAVTAIVIAAEFKSAGY